MWVEHVTLENIKCFEKLTVKVGDSWKPYKWVTLLGENGAGKSTILQALGLLLAGPEAANQLLTRPVGWVRDESKVGKLSARLHKAESDPGVYGEHKKRGAFSFTYHVTGGKKISIRNKEYSDPAIVENADKILSWLRRNAFSSKGRGWFAAGFGAFRRLTRSSQVIVPLLQSPERYTGFSSQFNESEPLAVFEQWFVYLDYQIAKNNDPTAKRQQALAIEAINKVLPDGITFDSVNSDGRILFNVQGNKVATIGLSDGYRSVLALAGELIWRLLMCFPNSLDPLREEGVVLIDEIDIHLHPSWQRRLPGTLRHLFPNLQFIVATHSPFIAAGAGEDAVAYKLSWKDGVLSCVTAPNLSFFNVEKVLQSRAFELISAYSEETQAKIDQYYTLRAKTPRTEEDNRQLELVLPVVKAAMAELPEKSDLEKRMDKFLEKELPHDKGS